MNTSNLSKTANVVLSYLVSKSVNNSVTLTYSEMMNDTGIGSKHTLIKALYRLEQNSLITRESLGRNKPTLYTVAPQTNAPQTNAPQNDAPQINAPQTNAPQNDAPQTNAPQNDAPQINAPQNDAPQNDDDDEYDDYELYHPNEKMSPKSEIADDDDPEPTPVEPNYNVNPGMTNRT